MPQIVPPEVLDAGATERCFEGLRVDVRHRRTFVRENPDLVLADLPNSTLRSIASAASVM
jgi:hypothetical protein